VHCSPASPVFLFSFAAVWRRINKVSKQSPSHVPLANLGHCFRKVFSFATTLFVVVFHELSHGRRESNLAAFFVLIPPPNGGVSEQFLNFVFLVFSLPLLMRQHCSYSQIRSRPSK